MRFKLNIHKASHNDVSILQLLGCFQQVFSSRFQVCLQTLQAAAPRPVRQREQFSVVELVDVFSVCWFAEAAVRTSQNVPP